MVQIWATIMLVRLVAVLLLVTPLCQCWGVWAGQITSLPEQHAGDRRLAWQSHHHVHRGLV
jgi:hypothetical protein